MGYAMVQLNTRIPADLKEQGDRALERAGYTPSQAVRALWEFAVRHTHEPGAVHTMLEDNGASANDEGPQDRLSAFEDGLNILEHAYGELGLDLHESPDFQHLDYKELRASYYENRLEQED